MSQTTTTNANGTAPTTEPVSFGKRGFSAPCPKCGEEGVKINLACLDECVCPSCDEEFSLDWVRSLVTGWAPVLAWCDSAPLA